MTELLTSGFTDSWRSLHEGEAKYSWWSYRMAARERNVGWRIDYFLVSDGLRDRIVSADIHNQIYGSDHCPVELVLR
jgi:exodeoxyribonuclease-3